MPSKYQRKSQIRDPLKRIVIAMEGNKTEPLYFNAIKRKYRATSLKVVLLARDESNTNSAPSHVVEQLNKSNGTVVDVAKVIARPLKKYYNVQSITKGEPCPRCREPLVLEGGCKTCRNPECGWSACE